MKDLAAPIPWTKSVMGDNSFFLKNAEEEIIAIGILPTPAKLIIKCINSHDQLVEALKNAYLNLIIAGHRSIEVAALTDSIKASLRNTLSDVTGRDCQELQDSFEQQARAALKSAKQ